MGPHILKKMVFDAYMYIFSTFNLICNVSQILKFPFHALKVQVKINETDVSFEFYSLLCCTLRRSTIVLS